MTLSKEDRASNIRFTLSVLLEQLDDRYLGNAYFEIGDPDFAQVLPTSWCEMERVGLIQERLIAKEQTHYRLTGKGYCVACR